MAKKTGWIMGTALAATVAVTGCTAAAAAPGAAPAVSAEQQVTGLFDGWNAALATGDPAVVAARYTDDALLLPTVAAGMHDTPEEIRGYFTEFLKKKPVGTVTESDVRMLGDGLASHSGLYTFRLSPAGAAPSTVSARFTFVYQRDDAGVWRILEHHSSTEPVSA